MRQPVCFDGNYCNDTLNDGARLADESDHKSAPPSDHRGGAVAFFLLLFRRLGEDKAAINAAALTYTTLLALVPLMTVTFIVLAAFPVGELAAERLQDFVFDNFVPAAGEVVQNYLSEFADKASKLTGTSFLFLIVTSLLLMASIDRAFNDIWRVRRQRKIVNKFLVYWAVITVGPILMVLSVGVTSYLLSLPLISGPDALIDTSRLLKLTPLVLSTLAFSLLYLLVPMRRVPIWHAIVGGVTAALLFELAKRGFGLYVAYVPTYQAIYGAIATVPIFLIWVFLTWLVTLFGAEVTYCLGLHGEGGGRKRPETERMEEAVAVLEALWNAQLAGESLSHVEVAARSGVPVERAEVLIDGLYKADWVVRTEDEKWMLARDLNHLQLTDLYAIGEFAIPRPEFFSGLDRQGRSTLAKTLKDAHQELETSLDVPLTSLFRDSTMTASSEG